MNTGIVVAVFCLGLSAGGAMGQTKPQTMESLIQQLRAADSNERDEALDQIGDLIKGGVTPEAARRLIVAAGEGLPVSKSRYLDPATSLIEMATDPPRAELVAPLHAVFDKLDDGAKAATIEFLVRANTELSLQWFAQLLPQYADKLEWSWKMASDLGNILPNDTMLPVIMDALGHHGTAQVAAGALLDGAANEHIPPEYLSEKCRDIAAAYRPWLQALDPVKAKAKSDPPEGYRWQDEYRHNLTVTEYFPDLLGYAGPGAETVLRESLQVGDPRISLFCVRSLLRLKREVPQKDIELVAADDEMRNTLYETLVQFDQEGRFPKQFHTQEAFARSEMVRWLIYPTELDRAPNEIELMKVIDVDTHSADGVVAVYLFRFRTTGKHWAAEDGWMAGIAGGYKKADMPTTKALGDTFSSFTKWDAKTPEQHVDDTIKLLNHASRRRASEPGKK